MAYVYLLATYEEHGSEEMVATLDRGRIPALLVQHWPTAAEDAEYQAALTLYLGKPDSELAARRSGWGLGSGWGGVQLFVVELT